MAYGVVKKIWRSIFDIFDRLIEELFMREFEADEYLSFKMEFAQERITALEKSEIPWQKKDIYQVMKDEEHYRDQLNQMAEMSSDRKKYRELAGV